MGECLRQDPSHSGQAWLALERVVNGLFGSATRTHVGLLVPGMRGMSSRQCTVRPAIPLSVGITQNPNAHFSFEPSMNPSVTRNTHSTYQLYNHVTCVTIKEGACGCAHILTPRLELWREPSFTPKKNGCTKHSVHKSFNSAAQPCLSLVWHIVRHLLENHHDMFCIEQIHAE